MGMSEMVLLKNTTLLKTNPDWTIPGKRVSAPHLTFKPDRAMTDVTQQIALQVRVQEGVFVRPADCHR